MDLIHLLSAVITCNSDDLLFCMISKSGLFFYKNILYYNIKINYSISEQEGHSHRINYPILFNLIKSHYLRSPLENYKPSASANRVNKYVKQTS